MTVLYRIVIIVFKHNELFFIGICYYKQRVIK